MSTELVIANAQELVRQQTDIASLCKEIVLRTVKKIGDRNFVPVEGWQSIAAAHGYVPTITGVEKIEGGYLAIAELSRISDGVRISRAEGYVGNDEDTWGNRDEYAKRAMAQTRAMSRLCRTCFAHVVVLMNCGLETTPAEEVPDGGFGGRGSSAEHRGPSKELQERAEKLEGQDAGSDAWKNMKVPFGKSKGKTYGEIEQRDLSWHLKRLEEKLEKDGQLKYANDRALLEGLRAHFAPKKAPASQEDDIPGLTTKKADAKLVEADVIHGPQHQQLSDKLSYDGFDVLEVLEVMRRSKKIPAGAKDFSAISEELAGKINERYSDLVAAINEIRDAEGAR